MLTMCQTFFYVFYNLSKVTQVTCPGSHTQRMQSCAMHSGSRAHSSSNYTVPPGANCFNLLLPFYQFQLIPGLPQSFLNWAFFFSFAVWLLGDVCECGGSVGKEVPWTEVAVGIGAVRWEHPLQIDQVRLPGGLQ